MVVSGGPLGTSNSSVHCLKIIYDGSPSLYTLPAPNHHSTLHLTHRKLVSPHLGDVGTAVYSVDTSLTYCFSPNHFSLCSDEHRRQSTIYYKKMSSYDMRCQSLFCVGALPLLGGLLWDSLSLPGREPLYLTHVWKTKNIIYSPY